MTHVAAIFALFITKIFKDISVEELERHTGNELVAAACTMGVAVTYGAPVGGQCQRRAQGRRWEVSARGALSYCTFGSHCLIAS